jgi:hypothetical protein
MTQMSVRVCLRADTKREPPTPVGGERRLGLGQGRSEAVRRHTWHDHRAGDRPHPGPILRRAGAAEDAEPAPGAIAQQLADDACPRTGYGSGEGSRRVRCAVRCARLQGSASYASCASCASCVVRALEEARHRDTRQGIAARLADVLPLEGGRCTASRAAARIALRRGRLAACRRSAAAMPLRSCASHPGSENSPRRRPAAQEGADNARPTDAARAMLTLLPALVW